MKTSTLLLTLVSALLSVLPASAQRDVPLRKIRAVKTGTELTLLDKIESDTRLKLYEYNEYGYITSVMEYSKVPGDTSWELSTDLSYLQEYTFDAEGRCTSRTCYNVDADGNKTTMRNKGEVVREGGLTWERYYDTYYDGTCHLDEAYAYDQWGNCIVEADYGYDEYEQKEYIREYTRREYTGPVDAYAAHYEADNIKNRRLVSELRAEGYSNMIYTTDPNDLIVRDYSQTTWETSGNKLYRRNFTWDSMEQVTVGQIESKKTKLAETEYVLNAEGTRPLSATERTYDIYGSNEERVERTMAYEWDSYGRLLKLTFSRAASSDIGVARETATSSEIERIEQYTYADDYAKTLTLQEAILTAEDYHNIHLYPEDYYQAFGRISSMTVTNCDYYDNTTEESTFTWDAEGHLTGGTWTETDHDDISGSDTPDEDTEKGEVRVAYNADGHMAWLIDHSLYDDYFYKEEYVYDERGMWIGIREYNGSSFDGPWRLIGESIGGSKSLRARRTAGPGKSPEFIDDMAEGYHDIDHNDGTWNSQGYYYVGEGRVRYGNLNQHLVSNASLPSNPENNYTDPLMPFESNDEIAVCAWQEWHYVWNTETDDWVCEHAPQNAHRVYAADGHIVCDFYDSDKRIVSSTSYYLDTEGHLTREQYSQGGSMTYEYLSGTDYLQESVRTDADGTRHVCHYYYSLHNYVEPTGIDNAQSSGQEDSVWYDLQGRRITAPSVYGIYIVNGKKVIR